VSSRRPPKRQNVTRVLRDIGARVREARHAASLTQEEAADRAGIGLKRWQVLEYGSANVTVRTLVRVANALGVSFVDLVGTSPRSSTA
jgi:transcriptional regulator with XRE-family HTH domain